METGLRFFVQNKLNMLLRFSLTHIMMPMQKSSTKFGCLKCNLYAHCWLLIALKYLFIMNMYFLTDLKLLLFVWY